MIDRPPETAYELFQSCPVIALATDGSEAGPEELSPGIQVFVLGERDGRLLLESRGAAPESRWQYLAERAVFERALTAPEDLPRGGSAPGVTVDNHGGSPD